MVLMLHSLQWLKVMLFFSWGHLCFCILCVSGILSFSPEKPAIIKTTMIVVFSGIIYSLTLHKFFQSCLGSCDLVSHFVCLLKMVYGVICLDCSWFLVVDFSSWSMKPIHKNHLGICGSTRKATNGACSL